MSYLARITECEHGFLKPHGTGIPWDCPGGSTTRIEPDYEAAWKLYYVLADRRRNAGLTFGELSETVDAALGGTE